MSHAREGRHPALLPLLARVAPLGVDVRELVLKVKPSAFVLPSGHPPSDAQRLGFACVTILAAERAFGAAGTVWNNARDEALADALQTLYELAPDVHDQGAAEAIVSLWSGSMLLRMARAADAFSEEASMAPISQLMSADFTPTFPQLWQAALSGFSKGVNSVLAMREKAESAHAHGLLTRVIPEHSRQLLALFENGDDACPGFKRVLLDWPASGNVAFDDRRFLQFERYRWDIVRWALLLAILSDNEDARERWSSALSEGKQAHPDEARGAGPNTLTLLLDKGGLRPVSPEQVRQAQKTTRAALDED